MYTDKGARGRAMASGRGRPQRLLRERPAAAIGGGNTRGIAERMVIGPHSRPELAIHMTRRNDWGGGDLIYLDRRRC